MRRERTLASVRHVDRLLQELEALDGGRECEVVRSALGAGVPELVVVEELEREVARRRARLVSDEWPSTP
jgi:hypothetical protein